jgi:hypothetical protein
MAAGAGWWLAAYLDTATEARSGSLISIAGTVLVRQPRQAQWASADGEAALSEGAWVRTDGVSQGFVYLADQSTLQVFSATELQLTESAAARFGPEREFIGLTLRSGKVHIGVAPAGAAARTLRVMTPQGELRLEEGGYTITVDRASTRVRVAERGAAFVQTGASAGTVGPGQRGGLQAGGVLPPTQAHEELVFNGDFAQGMAGWRAGNIAGFREGADIPGVQELVYDQERLASRFVRRGSKGTHSETFVYQDIDRDMTDFKDLRLGLDMRVKYQNLSGGGYIGTEYPVLVRLTYRYAGGETSVTWGFYYENPDNNRTDFGVPVPKDAWVHYEVPVNIITLNPPPQRIMSLQVSASGWDYESLVTKISLAGQ